MAVYIQRISIHSFITENLDFVTDVLQQQHSFTSIRKVEIVGLVSV